MGPASARGAALVDVLSALAVVALVSATTVPVVAGAMERQRTALGAQYVAARLTDAQLEALKRGVAVALQIGVEAEDTTLRMFVDGNGNGVLRSDIEAGIDRPVGPLDRLGAHAQGVSLRINQRVPDPGGTGWLEAGSDPLRIGQSTIVSCAPMGSVTSGTIYVASSGGPQMAVRITGSTGRVRVLRYEPSRAAWLP